MREILFRGKSEYNGKWVNGSLHIELSEIDKQGDKKYDYRILGLQGECDYVIPETIGQYTGLTDKNGKKIFEGDIVKHHFGEEKGIVKFGEYRQPFNDDIHTKHIGFYVDWISGEQKELLRKDLGYWANIDNDYEIFIGNIHDNPELLKKEEQE